jgi:hypothetical protein
MGIEMFWTNLNKRRHIMTTWPVHPNKGDFDENFWGHNWRVLVSSQGCEFIVNAEHEQAAIDYVIDWCEDNAPGLLMDREEEAEEEFLDDYICGGNHGRYLSTFNVNIEEI